MVNDKVDIDVCSDKEMLLYLGKMEEKKKSQGS